MIVSIKTVDYSPFLQKILYYGILRSIVALLHLFYRWVCGTASPCGEIIPHSGKTPEYYLLLEASNM